METRIPTEGVDEAEVPGTGNDVPVQEQYAKAQPASDEVKPEDMQAQPGIFTNNRGNLKVGSCRRRAGWRSPGESGAGGVAEGGSRGAEAKTAFDAAHVGESVSQC